MSSPSPEEPALSVAKGPALSVAKGEGVRGVGTTRGGSGGVGRVSRSPQIVQIMTDAGVVDTQGCRRAVTQYLQEVHETVDTSDAEG